MKQKGADQWSEVKEKISVPLLILGPQTAAVFLENQYLWLQYLACYRFIAKMMGIKTKILDIECGEGWGTWLLAKECGAVVGLTSNSKSLEFAQENFFSPEIKFEDFAKFKFDHSYQGALSVSGVIRPSERTLEEQVEELCGVVENNGKIFLAIRNTFSGRLTYSQLETHLRKALGKHYSFVFSVSGGTVHSGFSPMAESLLLMGQKSEKHT